MRYDAVIFDLDGTLINSIPDISIIVNSLIHPIGMTARTDAQIKDGVGFGVEHLLRTLGVPERLNASLAAKVGRAYAVVKDSKSFPYPGVPEMLAEVSNAGITMFVLSNKIHAGLEKSISDHLAFANFLGARGSLLGQPAKPSPGIMLSMLEEYGIAPETVLMVGDGEPDILVAKAAGVSCLSVLWGYRNRETLKAVGAEVFAETPEDVVSFLLRQEQ